MLCGVLLFSCQPLQHFLGSWLLWACVGLGICRQAVSLDPTLPAHDESH